MAGRIQALTEKEKQTLRLLVIGYDAKSMARHLGLSIHTINERLRDARRKMSVSSSREAARLLRDAEGGDPHFLADKQLRDAQAPIIGDDYQPLKPARAARRRAVWLVGGIVIMSLVLAMSALLSSPAAITMPAALSAAAPIAASAADSVADSEASQAARQWLELGDAGRWDDGYKATAAAFQKLNTSKAWADVSQQVRVPLGALVSRVLISEVSVPAPPNGYQVVKFRSSFANKPSVIETVALLREDGNWKVVGIYLD